MHHLTINDNEVRTCKFSLVVMLTKTWEPYCCYTVTDSLHIYFLPHPSTTLFILSAFALSLFFLYSMLPLHFGWCRSQNNLSVIFAHLAASAWIFFSCSTFLHCFSAQHFFCWLSILRSLSDTTERNSLVSDSNAAFILACIITENRKERGGTHATVRREFWWDVIGSAQHQRRIKWETFLTFWLT